MFNIRLVFSIIVGKSVIVFNRMVGKKGTSLPGMIALKICPDLIRQLRNEHDKVVVVTGTNGKTTTSNLLADILRAGGTKLTHNSAGANMVSGIATAFIESSDLMGKTESSIAVVEIDEATMPKVIPMLDPDMVVITNFFRDQLDRYGELDKTIALTVEAIDKLKNTLVLLNADDPLVATIGSKIKLPVKYFGVSQNRYSYKESNQVIEGRYCPICQGEYKYEYYHYGQLGLYHCPQCGYRRPEPDYLVDQVDLSEKVQFRVNYQGETKEFLLSTQGFYNLYNALAAITASLECDCRIEDIRKGLGNYKPKAGRMENFKIDGKDTTLTLVKNPTGFNEVLKTLVQSQGQKGLVIAINDLDADGRDVSWLWDVDFEVLNDASLDFIICSGLRGEDMAVRLKYAGVDTSKISIVKDLKQAIVRALEKTVWPNRLYVLPTYTNLFPSQKILNNTKDIEGTIAGGTNEI